MTAAPNGTASCCGHRSYQKEVQVGKKAVAVDISVTEVHARILRKLDRSTAPAESEVTEEAPE